MLVRTTHGEDERVAPPSRSVTTARASACVLALSLSVVSAAAAQASMQSTDGLAAGFDGLAAGFDGLAEGFEEVAAGPLIELDDVSGSWHAQEGHARIDDQHARSGRQCLHLLGGDDARVELRFPALTVACELELWAERWTRATPFSFTISAFDGEEWGVVHDGSKTIVIGGFKTRVRVALPSGIEALRFACTSPAGKGILIDDLALVPIRPMEITSCRAVQPILPVLVGNRLNPVLRVDIETRGGLDPLRLESLVIDLEGTTNLSDFERVEVFRGGAIRTLGYREPDAVFGDEERCGAVVLPESGPLRFEFDALLESGLNTFWISVTPKPGADIDGFVDAGVVAAALTDGRALAVEDARPAGRQRLGVALRSAGDGGAAAYRIPGLVTTNSGALIGVYDVRWKGWGDLPGHIDVGMSRSTDGGRTWEPMRVIMDMGDDSEWRGDGIGDPAILVDRGTGDVLVIATWSHGNRSWRGSGPGLSPTETGQLMLTRSTDDGVTWSEPRNLTRMVKDPEWSFILQGPGRGITMGDGTLVFPAQFQLSPEEGRVPHSTLISSGDGGRTWRSGSGVRPGTTESAVVELAGGALMLNMRDNRGGTRSVFVSSDLGATWTEHASSRSALIEPVCMASLIHVGRELTGEADGRLLFSNPFVSRGPRRRMSIRSSSDFGGTWSDGAAVLLDEGASAGYSCLTMIDEATVGIVYEGSRAHMTFQRVPLAELFD